jgi:hypothetical protein
VRRVVRRESAPFSPIFALAFSKNRAGTPASIIASFTEWIKYLSDMPAPSPFKITVAVLQ